MSDPGEQPRILNVVASTSAVALTAAVLVFILTTWGWQSVIWSATHFAIFAVLPLTIVVGMLTKSLSHTVIACLAAIACGLPLYAWTMPNLRTEVLNTAGGAIPGSTLLKAIEDPADTVADAACVALVARGYDKVRFQLPELIRRPDVVSSCLTREIPGTDAPGLLRREVAQLWENKILSSTTANACRLLPSFLEVSGKQTVDMPARVLRIATSAQHADVRACAMEYFSTTYPTPLKQLKALGNPRDIDPVVAAELFRNLTTMTYGPLTSGLNKKMTATPLMRQWGLSLGCRVILDGHGAEDATVMLNTAVSLQGCGMAEGDSARLVWTETCSDALAESSNGLVTTSSVCQKIHIHAMEGAVLTTSTIVHAAIERLTRQELQRQIDRGNNDQQLVDRIERFSGMAMAEDSLDEMPPAMAQQLRQQIGGVRRQTNALHRERSGRMHGGANKGMMELFLATGKSGTLHGFDMKEAIKEAGGDPDEVFSDENVNAAKAAMNDRHIDQSGINDEGADAGMEEDDAGLTVEDFIGRQRAEESSTESE